MVKTIFLKGMASKIVLSINGQSYMSKIAKSAGTYSHIVKNLHSLEEKGIVTLNKEGRTVFVALTEKGEIVKSLIIKLDKLTA